jgi:cation-transporting ATPase E
MTGQPESIDGAPAGIPQRPETTPPAGLTDAEVASRIAQGLSNAGGERPSRSVAEILRGNILTRFNFILGSLLVVILVVGQLQDALFGIVLVANALIGIAQEPRAKRTLDRLALLSAPRVHVIRKRPSKRYRSRLTGTRRPAGAPQGRPNCRRRHSPPERRPAGR